MAIQQQEGSRSQSFFEENQKVILGGITVILVFVIGFILYHNLIRKPREAEAVNAIYMAEMQFERDSFENALLNPGAGNMGFLDIIDEYKRTPTANLAKYYAGISYLKLGRYEAAVSYLEDFKAKGKITPITKYGALGDAYSELEQYNKAISAYKKAADAGNNSFLTPYYLKKLGMLYEHQEKYKDALTAYHRIRDNYPDSPDGYNIEKYIDNIEFNQQTQ